MGVWWGIVDCMSMHISLLTLVHWDMYEHALRVYAYMYEREWNMAYQEMGYLHIQCMCDGTLNTNTTLFLKLHSVLHFSWYSKILCSEDLFWFQSYWGTDNLYRNFRLLLGNSMVVINNLFTYVEQFSHQLLHLTGLQLFVVNRDGCHIWGNKCSLYVEHLISLPLVSSWFHPIIIIYIYYIMCQNWL